MTTTDGNLRALFREHIHGQWTSVETGLVAQGVPDAEFCLPPVTQIFTSGRSPVTQIFTSGRSMKPGSFIPVDDPSNIQYNKTKAAQGWIEFKQTGGWAISLRPEQIGWLDQRQRYGGRAFVAVRRQTKGGARTEAADELWLYALSDACRPQRLKAYGLRGTSPALMVAGGPSSWDWGMIEGVLREGG